MTTDHTPDAAVQIAAQARLNPPFGVAPNRAVVDALRAAGWLTPAAEVAAERNTWIRRVTSAVLRAEASEAAVARLRELLDARTADHDAVVAERDALAERVAALRAVADAARVVIADQALPDSPTMCDLASALDALPPGGQRR